MYCSHEATTQALRTPAIHNSIKLYQSKTCRHKSSRRCDMSVPSDSPVCYPSYQPKQKCAHPGIRRERDSELASPLNRTLDDRDPKTKKACLRHVKREIVSSGIRHATRAPGGWHSEMQGCAWNCRRSTARRARWQSNYNAGSVNQCVYAWEGGEVSKRLDARTLQWRGDQNLATCWIYGGIM